MSLRQICTQVIHVEFDPEGDVYKRISGTTQFMGCSMHVDLIEVDRSGNAVSEQLQRWIDAVKDADDGHTERYCTVKIGRKSYFPILTPFQK
jgi:hypothetical protein